MLFMYLYLVKLFIFPCVLFLNRSSHHLLLVTVPVQEVFSFSYTYVHVDWWCCTELWNYFKYINKNVNVHSCSPGCLWPFSEERQKFLIEYLAKMDWRLFWPELFWDFPRFYLVMHVHLNQIEGFDVCFHSWWLVSCLIFLRLYFLHI